MKKKLLALSLIAVMSLLFTACGNENDITTSSNTEVAASTQAIATETTTEAIPEATTEDKSNDFEPKGDSKAIDFDITFYDDFRNDATGKWRKALYAEPNEFQDYALDYYEQYFKDDSEVHVVYNFTTKTVYCVTNLSGMLSVNVTEYVDGEEHDAKVACSGTHLATYMVYLDSGVVEKF